MILMNHIHQKSNGESASDNPHTTANTVTSINRRPHDQSVTCPRWWVKLINRTMKLKHINGIQLLSIYIVVIAENDKSYFILKKPV